MKPIVADAAAAARRTARCSTTAHPPSSLLETRRSGRPREMVGPGPDAGGAGAHPDHRRAHSRPWQALAVALRHRRRRPARGARRAAPPRARTRRTRARPPAHHEKASSSRIRRGALVVLVSAPVHGPQDPGVGAGIVVRRGGNEPAASPPMRSAMSAAGSPAGRPIRRARQRRLLRAGRADRRLHLHRPSGRELEERPRPRAGRRSSRPWAPPQS